MLVYVCNNGVINADHNDDVAMCYCTLALQYTNQYIIAATQQRNICGCRSDTPLTISIYYHVLSTMLLDRIGARCYEWFYYLTDITDEISNLCYGQQHSRL
jgi:hypothetical protein